jgi:serine protease Do/serine protease DegQ
MNRDEFLNALVPTGCRAMAIEIRFTRTRLLFVIAFVFNLLGCSTASQPAATIGTTAPVTGQPLPTLAPMLERATPAVVNIASEGRITVRRNPLMDDPFFKRFFDLPDDIPQERRTQSLGSGVVLDPGKGFIVTNHHVVDRADSIMVTLRDGRNFKARVIGSDPETDVAIIQISANNLQSLPIANSDNLRVGDFVAAIGNPFGLGQTVTWGIVSALGRSGLGLKGYENFIQTDASINPGNSGGALVNLRGELVGINTAILAPTGGNVGIGFAIPVNTVKALMNQLIQFGRVKHGRLGIMVQDLTPDLAQSLGLRRSRGAVVSEVMPDSAAASANLLQGDIILAVDGKQVQNASALRSAIGLLPIGQRVKLDILRGGRSMSVMVRIGEAPRSAANVRAPKPRLAAGSRREAAS